MLRNFKETTKSSNEDLAMKVKKYIALALVSVMAISATLSGCSTEKTTEKTTEKEAEREIKENKKEIKVWQERLMAD